MYIIVSYDVNTKECSRIMKVLRKYLFHIQNSVFEGEITDKNLHNLRDELEKKVNYNTDNIVFFILPSNKMIKIESIGVKQKSKYFY